MMHGAYTYCRMMHGAYNIKLIIHELLYSDILKNVLDFCHIHGVGEHYYRGVRRFFLETVRLRQTDTETET